MVIRIEDASTHQYDASTIADLIADSVGTGYEFKLGRNEYHGDTILDAYKGVMIGALISILLSISILFLFVVA